MERRELMGKQKFMKSHRLAKGQISTFVKMISVVIAVGMFVFIVYQYQAYKLNVIREKERSQFRISVLSTLQKLVSDGECLAYVIEGEISFKPVLEKNKIDYFAENYEDLEPECAKALDFDYSIELTQLEKHFRTYRGEKIVEGECVAFDGIAIHGGGTPWYYVCDKDLSDPYIKDRCCLNEELDRTTWPAKLKCGIVTCAAYDCSEHTKSEEECEYIWEGTSEKACCIRKTCVARHPRTVQCYNIDADSDCIEQHSYGHAWCGDMGTYERIPVGVAVDATIESKVWGFAISSGITSFSPEKAKKDEIELSLPVTIKYNETYSTEGMITIRAVSGELESFYSTLEDVCEKAKAGIETKFSKYFKFSYPVSRDEDRLCMMDNCKIFDCPLSLVFDGIGVGEHVLHISSSIEGNEIEVRK